MSQLGGRRAVEGGGTPPFEACSSPGASTVTRPVTRGRRLREGNGTVRGLRGALGGSRGFESLSAHLTGGCRRRLSSVQGLGGVRSHPSSGPERLENACRLRYSSHSRDETTKERRWPIRAPKARAKARAGRQTFPSSSAMSLATTATRIRCVEDLQAGLQNLPAGSRGARNVAHSHVSKT